MFHFHMCLWNCNFHLKILLYTEISVIWDYKSGELCGKCIAGQYFTYKNTIQDLSLACQRPLLQLSCDSSTQAFHHEQNLVSDPSPPFWAEPVGHLSVFVSPPVTAHNQHCALSYLTEQISKLKCMKKCMKWAHNEKVSSGKSWSKSQVMQNGNKVKHLFNISANSVV